MASEFTAWIDYLTLNFVEIFSFAIPISCIGATVEHLILQAIWPFAMILLGALILYGFTFATSLCKKRDDTSMTDEAINSETSSLELKEKVIQLSIIVIYFALPSVSQNIFDAVNCRPFQISDEPIVYQSYLLMNMDIVCDSKTDAEYGRIMISFWALFAIWIILTPILSLWLLKRVSTAIRTNRITMLANSCRFLWNDYKPSFWYWDVVDILRKIILTGLIIFIDRKEGSNKFMRLTVAIVFSVIYSFILLSLRPYRRSDDYFCAFASNMLLVCCFSLGIILKHCSEEDLLDDYDSGESYGEEKECSRFVGLNSGFRASLIVVTLVFSVLVLTVVSILILGMYALNTPKTKLISTGHAPNLELPEQCNYHVFVSHVWSTGQSKTHAIVRKMQLLLPGLKIWLDVDELYDLSELESSVEDSAVFLL